MDPLPSDSSHQEEDRQESVERVGLFHPGRADQGLHGREPESQEGERRPLLRQGHDAQVSHVDYLRIHDGLFICSIWEFSFLFSRDQELVCRENERLLKKLEDVNS